MAAESYACQLDDHSICSVDDSDVCAVALADIHFERCGDPLMWFDKFCVTQRIQECDRVHSELESWCRVLYLAGTYEEASRRVQSYVDAYSDKDHVSFEVSKWFSLWAIHVLEPDLTHMSQT